MAPSTHPIRERGLALVCALKRALVLVGVAVAEEAAGAPTEYFVAAHGSDAASGTSERKAWKTLQTAAERAQAGDVVTVLPGHYRGFKLTTPGTAQAPIVFRAKDAKFAPNEQVVVDRNEPIDDRDRIHVAGASHVVIEGFTVLGDGAPATGHACIRISGSGTSPAGFVTVRNNRCDSSGRLGVFASFVDDLRVEGNQVWRSAAHGIHVSSGGDRPLVRGNDCWRNHGCGILLDGAPGPNGDGVIRWAVVEKNVLRDNGRAGAADAAIAGDGIANATLRNNLLTGNHGAGIALFREIASLPPKDNAVVHNTLHMAADARFGIEVRDAAAGNTVHNNVVFNDAAAGAIRVMHDSFTGLACDFNVVEDHLAVGDRSMTLGQWKAVTGLDVHTVVSDPASTFADVAAGDYELDPASPAHDSAAPVPPTLEDILGKPRPHGLGYDRGCYEHRACSGGFGYFGIPLPGAWGESPTILGNGCPDLGEMLTIEVVPPQFTAPGQLFFGTESATFAFKGGFLFLVPTLALPVQGATTLAFQVPAIPALAGKKVLFQAAFRDDYAIQGVALSDLLLVAIG